MKTKLLFIATVVFLLTGNFAKAQNQTGISRQAAEKWIKAGKWRNGLNLSLFADVNAVEFYSQYHENKAVWIKAFQFLKQNNLDTLSPGKYSIDADNAFASVTETPSKTLDKAAWESHRKYIDLQYVIKGKERIDVADIDKATVTSPYDDAKDVANYTANGKGYTAEPGTFYLFFAQDVHRPNIKIDGYDVVKKIVIKIKVAN